MEKSAHKRTWRIVLWANHVLQNFYLSDVQKPEPVPQRGYRYQSYLSYKSNFGPYEAHGDKMLLKLLAFGFVAVVFLGLGLGGTLNAAFVGYHKIASNPVVEQIQSKTTEIKDSASSELHSIAKNGLSSVS